MWLLALKTGLCIAYGCISEWNSSLPLLLKMYTGLPEWQSDFGGYQWTFRSFSLNRTDFYEPALSEWPTVTSSEAACQHAVGTLHQCFWNVLLSHLWNMRMHAVCTARTSALNTFRTHTHRASTRGVISSSRHRKHIYVIKYHISFSHVGHRHIR